jgi:hypothetical protein
MKDLVSVINFHKKEGKQVKPFVSMMKEILRNKITFKYHQYCKGCKMPASPQGCPTKGCPVKGKSRGSFLTFSLREQIKDVLDGSVNRKKMTL